MNLLRKKPSTASLLSGQAAGAADEVNARDPALFDEEFLARLRQLVLLSRRSILHGIAGEHRSRRRGSSPEFSDFKSYSPGDDFRRIDWNIYARLDEVFVRLSEISTELNVHLLIDVSESMNWRGKDSLPSKFFFARRLAGALGYVSLWHFDRVYLTPFSDRLGATFGPVQGRSNITPMLKVLTDMPTSGSTALPESIARYASQRRQPGLMYVISDLLTPDTRDIESALRDLRARGWETIIVHVVDPEEVHPDHMLPRNDSGHWTTVELTESETGEQLQITPDESTLQNYQTLLDTWMNEVAQLCVAEDAQYVRLQTDSSLESLVLTRLYDAGVVR